MAESSKSEHIIRQLTEDPDLRAEVTYMLARDYPSEYLNLVSVDKDSAVNALADIKNSYLISDKEWQE